MNLRKYDQFARFVLFSLLLIAVFYVVIIVTATHREVTELNDRFDNATIYLAE